MGLLHKDAKTVHAKTIGEALELNDLKRNPTEEAKQRYLAGPGRKYNLVAFSHTVTVRYRDSMEQERVALDDLVFFIQKAIKNYKPVSKN